LIGEADPKNVVEEIGRGSETKTGQQGQAKSQNVRIDDLPGVLGYLQGQGTGAAPASGKAKKR
jgi:hypothetical protein